MNKRKFLLFSLLLFTLSSCGGTSISKEEAKKIVDNITTSLENNEINYNKFSYTYLEEHEGATLTIKSVFDKENRYFHYYKISPEKNEDLYYYNIYEEWCYVKTNDDKSETLYKVSKTIEKNNVSEMIVDKDAFLWSEKENNIVEELNNYLVFSLDNILTILEIDSESMNLTSINSSSINVNNKSDKYNIENNYLKTFTKVSDDKKASIEVNYDRVTLNYPIFNEN